MLIRVGKWPARIVYIRHGESRGNAEKNAHGATPHTPLTKKGIRQCEQTRKWFEKDANKKNSVVPPISVYYTSTLPRAQHSAQIIFPEVLIYEDPRLDEWWRGIHHSVADVEEIRRLHPHAVELREQDGDYHHRPLMGEAGKDAEIRVLSFLDSFTSDMENPCIIGHGRLFAFTERILCGKEKVTEFKEQVPNASVWLFERSMTDRVYTLKQLFAPKQ